MKIVIISQTDPPLLFPASAITTVIIRTVADLEAHRDADLYIDLDFIIDPDRLSALDLLLPSLVIVNAVTPTLDDIGRPFIRINGWPGFLERELHELVVPDENIELEDQRVVSQPRPLLLSGSRHAWNDHEQNPGGHHQ